MGMSNVQLIRPSYRQKVNAALYARMLSHLMVGASVADLVEETGLTKATVRKHINALWNHGVVRISMWEATTTGRRVIAVYKVGLKTDAKQPALTPNERKAKYREKKKREKERMLQQAWKDAA
jgi:DNA-binding MarR family transcriptional regulator